MSASLPEDRLERRLLDKKPLLTFAEAKAESERCLYCVDAPCIKACPTEIDIPTFIKKIASDNVKGSATTIFAQNILGYSCARVCPVEVLCEGSCVYTAWQHDPISIGRLQRYATQHATAHSNVVTPKSNALPKRVACVGAGPASLACAAYLAIEGHKATVFEKRPYAGGLNTTGIAPYKLHAEDALHEVDFVKSLGVEVVVGKEIGKDLSAEELLKYDAVFLGLGLGIDTKLGIEGEDGPGVFGATAWIEEMKLAKDGSAAKLGHVIVVGGGNTAIDVARECAQLDPSGHVTMVYRRSREKMSGYAHELTGAKKESVQFSTNTQPVKVMRDAGGALKALRVAKTNANGEVIAGTEHDVACDRVIVAIGQAKLREIASQFTGVKLDARGCIAADSKTGVTANPKVYSGGDCINGGKEVVNAVADGRNAARAMMRLWS